MNSGRVCDLRRFEELVSKVIDVYKDVCNFFLIYFNFLIGEVEVWLVCIGWIMKYLC